MVFLSTIHALVPFQASLVVPWTILRDSISIKKTWKVVSIYRGNLYRNIRFIDDERHKNVSCLYSTAIVKISNIWHL
ncbi:hypothetical protein Plhal703r1_c03g0014261 [Plasmopara halstedii]